MEGTSEGVTLREALEWAWEQGRYLKPTQQLVLLYLVFNSFLRPDNPEGQEVGTVMAGRTPLRQIQKRTGLSKRSVQYALRGLQHELYILTEMKPGRGKSIIIICWGDAWDEVRDEVRRGLREAPRGFREESTKVVEEPRDAKILAFPKVHRLHL